MAINAASGSWAMSPMVSTPRACSLAAVLAPMPHIRSTGSAWRKASSRPRHDEQPVGLGHGAGDLGQELGAGDADADRQAHPFAHRAAQPDGDLRRRARRAPQPAHVEERLVDRDAFDERRRVVEHLEHRLAGGGVGGQVRFDEDGVGAQPPGDRPAHGGAHAVRPGLVAGAHHHARADDHRAAAQLGWSRCSTEAKKASRSAWRIDASAAATNIRSQSRRHSSTPCPRTGRRVDNERRERSHPRRDRRRRRGDPVLRVPAPRPVRPGRLLHPARRAGRAGRAPRWRLHHLARGGPVVRRRPRPLPRRRVGGPRAAGPVHRRRRRRRAGDAGARGVGGGAALRPGAALRRRRDLRVAAGTAPGRCRVATRRARRPLRRRGRRQRAARQPADPPVRVRRVVARGVGGGRTGRVVRRGALGTARPAPLVLPATAPHGARAPLHDDAVAWVDVARASVERGRIVAFDYARATTAELARRPWREWLRTYRGHERAAPTTSTRRAPRTSRPSSPSTSSPNRSVAHPGEFLRRWGIDELVAEGVSAWTARAARPTWPPSPCAAGPSRPGPCSTRPASAPSSSWSGRR